MRKISPARLVYSDLLGTRGNALLSLVVRDSIANQIAALGIVQTPAIDVVFRGDARPD
jgi:hypothetical protein